MHALKPFSSSRDHARLCEGFGTAIFASLISDTNILLGSTTDGVDEA